MRKMIYITGIFAFLVLCGADSFAQIRKIPAEVTDAFTDKYPNAKSVEWRDKLSGFTASFTDDDVHYLASFKNKGEWESTEHVIDFEDLADVVKDGLDKSRYSDWNVTRVTEIELPENELQYRIEVGKGDIKKRNLYFNSKGRMLKDKLTL